VLYGTRKPQKPRFAVTDADAEVFGRWTDNNRAAFAKKAQQGWTSIYTGSAPLTADILRRLAKDAGVPLWSDRADIVYATHDAAAVIATGAGERTLTFPRPMQQEHGGEASTTHRVTMEFGEVRIFLVPGT
jgi:hypothetical protein